MKMNQSEGYHHLPKPAAAPNGLYIVCSLPIVESSYRCSEINTKMDAIKQETRDEPDFIVDIEVERIASEVTERLKDFGEDGDIHLYAVEDPCKIEDISKIENEDTCKIEDISIIENEDNTCKIENISITNIAIEEFGDITEETNISMEDLVKDEDTLTEDSAIGKNELVKDTNGVEESIIVEKEIVANSKVKEEYTSDKSVSEEKEVTNNIGITRENSPVMHEKIIDDHAIQNYQDMIHELDKLDDHVETGEQETITNNSESELEAQSERYVCNICMKTYKLLKYLSNHMTTHLARNPFVCISCGKSFKTSELLNKHVLDVHILGLTKSFSCNVCKKSFLTQQLLSYHKRIHVDFSFHCSKCPRNFCFEVDYNSHLKTHNKNVKQKHLKVNKKNLVGSQLQNNNYKNDTKEKISKKEHACEVCKKRFEQKLALTLHLRIHFDTKQKRSKIANNYQISKSPDRDQFVPDQFKCDLCNYVTPYKRYIWQHIVFTHNIYYCGTCKISFQSQISYDNHKKKHANKRFPCKSCKRKFRNRNELKLHIKKFHVKKFYKMPKEKDGHGNFLCVMCKEKFSSFEQLKQHVPVHIISNQIEFTCKLCDKGFSDDISLKSHSCRMNAFSCDVCKDSFTEEKDFNEHSCIKIFTCEICEDSFLSIDELVDHSCTKTFNCNNCNDSFSNLNQFHDHTCINIVTCRFCDECFLSINELSEHECVSEMSEHFTNESGIRMNDYNKDDHKTHNNGSNNPLETCNLRPEVESDVNVFVCSVCKQKFTCDNSLKSHVSQHIL